ncbi:hypothetical protein C8R43DRAFT_1129435 [Mycena crocata]|nr:hypothetical protein C8R43DRAFT_1129435 [Mycena crocata]
MVSFFSLIIAAATIIPAFAVTKPTPALSGEWVITDFQGQCFNLVDTNPASLTPVQGWADKTVTASKVGTVSHGLSCKTKKITMRVQWIFVNTSTANVFEIVNVGAGSVLSYSTLINSGEAIRSQIVGNTQATTWKFTPPMGMLIESASGLAVTSYPVGTSGSNPFTLQQANAADSHQAFKITQGLFFFPAAFATGLT